MSADVVLVPVKRLFSFEERIAEARASGDVSELREIASELQERRIDCMAKFTRSKSERNRANLRAEYQRLGALVEPILPIISKRGAQ